MYSASTSPEAKMDQQSTLGDNSVSGSPPPRIQLFFVASLIKLLAIVLIGLVSFLKFPPLSSITSLILFLWLSIMLAIAMPTTPLFLAITKHWLRTAWRVSLVILIVAVSVEVVVITTTMVWAASDRDSLPPAAEAIMESLAPTDATFLTTQAAENLLAGKNPYAHADIIAATDASPEAYKKLTPLRIGAFADSFPYPTEEELKSFWSEAVANPDVIPPEIESKFNYPAGSFLLLASFTALGINDLRIALLAIVLPIIVCTIFMIAPHQRRYFIIGTLLALELWTALFFSDTRLLCLPFIMAGWLAAPRHPWISAILFGIAAATKQTAWFFLPFYLILIWRTAGLRPALRSGVVVGLIFFVANAPFIAADPQLWLSSVLAPMTDELFPMGEGLISLVTSGLIHLDSSLVFTILEATAFIGGIIWYWHNARRYPHAGLFLAVMPLFFAWRSLWGYFYFVDLILLAAILSQGDLLDTKSQPAPQRT